MPRTKEQSEKYNYAKRLKTFTTAVDNVKALLSNDTILKDIDIETLTDDKISSMIKILKKVAVINKNKAKLNIVAPVEQPIAPVEQPIAPVEQPIVAPVEPPVVVASKKKKKPIVAPVEQPITVAQPKKKKPVIVVKPPIAPIKKKKSVAHVKAPEIKRQKLFLPDGIINSSKIDLKKKYNILMYQYNSMVSDLENIPKYDTDRITRIEKSLDSMLERLQKMEASA
jgi:hypothetical protein